MIRNNCATDKLHISHSISSGTITDKIAVQKDGNVGIGTISPQSQLNLHKQFTASGIRNTSGISFTTSNDTTNWGCGYIGGYILANNGTADGYPGGLVFKTKAADSTADYTFVDRMVIDSGGNLGIGTTSPGEKLHIVGDIRLQPGNDAKIAIHNNRIGLNIEGDNISPNNARYLYISNNAVSSTGSTFHRIYYETGQQHIFTLNRTAAGGSDRDADKHQCLTMTKPEDGGASSVVSSFPSGTVGIGTTSPDAGLEVTTYNTDTNPDGRGYYLITTLDPNNTSSGYNPWTATTAETGNTYTLQDLSETSDGNDLTIRLELEADDGIHNRYYRGFPLNACFNYLAATGTSSYTANVSDTAQTSFNGNDWTTVRGDMQIYQENHFWQWSFTRSTVNNNYNTDSESKYNNWPNQTSAHANYNNVGLYVSQSAYPSRAMGVVVLGGDPQNNYTATTYGPNDFSYLRVYAKLTDLHRDAIGGSDGLGSRVGIKSSYAILSNTYLAVSSDRRIKNEIMDSSNNEALEKIRNIPSRTYHYIDNERRQTEKTIGFIAQEVKEVIPSAVTLVNSFIPDQQRFITNFEWTTVTDSSNIILSSDEFTDISNGRYRFYLSNTDNYKEKTVEVNMNSDNTFTFDASYSSVYMYGKEVYDYNMLNKEKIFSLHHPAIQELDRQQQTDKSRIAELETQQQADKSRIAELETQLSSMLSRLSALESS